MAGKSNSQQKLRMQPRRESQTSGARTRRAKQATARLGQHELLRGPASAQTLRPQHSSGPQLQPREPESHKAATGVANKLGVSGLFSVPCLLQSDGAGRASQGASHTVGHERRHNDRVDRKLRSIPQGQAVGNDLDAAVVKTCDCHIQIAHTCVTSDTGPRLPANTSCRSLERASPTPQSTRPSAGCSMVAKRAERATARKGRRFLRFVTCARGSRCSRNNLWKLSRDSRACFRNPAVAGSIPP